MGNSTETLIFEIIGKDPSASRAFAQFRRQVDDTSKSVDKSSAGLDKNSKALDNSARSADKAAQSHRSLLGALGGTALAFAPITAGAAAAAAGVAAFAVLAVPSIKKVTTALSGPGGLAASWNTLDNRQRNAALGVQQLGRSYDALAKTLEPQVFQVFNQGLGTANSLLGPTGQLAHASAQGLSDFLAQFTNDSGIQHFIGFLSTQARPAIDLLGSDVTHLSHTVFMLLQSFGGAGQLELRALTGAFTALDNSVSFLSQHAPGLTSAGLAIGGIALAMSKLGVLGPVLKITGLASIPGQLAGFTAATKGATVAEKGLLATTTAFESITPWGWVAAGVAALGGLVFWMSKLGTGTESTVAHIEAQNRAVGFNTSGYFSAAKALQALNLEQKAQDAELVKGVQGSRVAAGATAALQVKTDALTAAQQKLVSEGRSQETFLDTLQSKYGLTRSSAISLAQHAGVLASQVNKGGSAMHNALTQAEAYADSNLKAQRPVSRLAADIADYSDKTLSATDRTKALSDALSAFFNPAVSADQAVITLRNDQRSLAKALDASGGKTGLLTQKQRDARSAFDTYINDVATAAQAAFTATGRTGDYNRVIDRSLPFLERAAGHNRTLRQEIQKLIDTESRIRSENVAIHVSGTGSWAVVGGGHRVISGGHPPGTSGAAALGMMVTGGTPGVDSVPILAQQGELIVPTPLVNAGAVDHLRGRIPGFAAGGVVGHYASHSLPGLNKWLNSENSATISAIADSVAAAFKAAAPGPGSGGGHVGWTPGAGVAQWASDVSSALKQLGLSDNLKLLVLYQMMTESGGNPNIVNKWDSNWLAGHPSVGLMQVIAGTFDAYAGPYRNTGPFEYGVSINPLANIYAALNYGAHNGRGFGTGPGQIGSGHGYANGTSSAAPGWAVVGERGPELVRFRGGEQVVPGRRVGGSHYSITVNVPPTVNKREVGRAVVEAIREFEKGSGSSWRRS